MTDLETRNPQNLGQPFLPQRIAQIRLVSDLLTILVAYFLINKILDQTNAQIILASTIGIFISTLIGYQLVDRGKTVTGMGFVIYGLVFGLSLISVFVEQLGLFTLVTVLLVTTLSVISSIPFRKIIIAMAAAFVLGVASLVFDLNFRMATFRLIAPSELTNILWGVILVLALIFIYLIARQFPYFSLRTKLIASFAAVTLLSLAVLGLINIYIAPIEQLTATTILLSLLSVVGVTAIALALTQVISAPILSLTKTADQLAKGDLTARVQITTEDEIGDLGKTLNIMATQLQNLVNNLEKQVANRTRDLENRAAHLQASAEVARDVTSEQQLDDLLTRAATLIQDRFGYYHVGIYLIDSKSEYAFLTATNDTPGKKLLETEHRYRIDPDSNVGYAVMVGESLLASVEDPTTQPNYHPMLQNSMSQMVLPLRQGNQVIGAIDIHSTNPTAFSEEDIQIYQILADQIAISIQKAKYQEETQDTLNELEAAYGVFTRESWRKFLQTRKNIAGFRYNQRQVNEVYTSPENVVRAWLEGQKISETKESPWDPKTKFTTLAIPMKVRGEVIGVLNVDFETDQVPADTTNLINEIADRLSLIIENARLIETAQRTAEREQLSSHISNQIRQSLDMDMILRTAVQEIGESLGLAEVELRLGKSSGSSSTAQPSGNGKMQSESS